MRKKYVGFTLLLSAMLISLTACGSGEEQSKYANAINKMKGGEVQNSTQSEEEAADAEGTTEAASAEMSVPEEPTEEDLISLTDGQKPFTDRWAKADKITIEQSQNDAGSKEVKAIVDSSSDIAAYEDEMTFSVSYDTQGKKWVLSSLTSDKSISVHPTKAPADDEVETALKDDQHEHNIYDALAQLTGNTRVWMPSFSVTDSELNNDKANVSISFDGQQEWPFDYSGTAQATLTFHPDEDQHWVFEDGSIGSDFSVTSELSGKTFETDFTSNEIYIPLRGECHMTITLGDLDWKKCSFASSVSIVDSTDGSHYDAEDEEEVLKDDGDFKLEAHDAAKTGPYDLGVDVYASDMQKDLSSFNGRIKAFRDGTTNEEATFTLKN